ncbi:MAG: lactaldehyde reductase [Chloroflexi bacterium]|nr:lactaldehyde reductase [Chloroflexota bacterium]
MATKRMILNETSYFGPGARNVLPEEINRRGYKRAFIVTDQVLLESKVTGLVLQILDQNKIAYQTYSNVKQNPTISNVKLGVDAFVKSGADFIIAVGGGSPIDAAKAIGIIANNPEYADVRSLEGFAATKHRSIPIIAIPTTAGTAAEVTINYVITDEDRVKKMVCIDTNDIPVVSIIDPELMVSMPKGLTAATGMDALTHAIEGYITKGAWEMTDFMELKAISLIARHLRNAVLHPSDMDARSGMALAQYIAGMGFSNVGLGIVHSMAHPLGAFYDTPHGVANALLLPYVMEFNAQAAGSKYGEIAIAMGLSGGSGENVIRAVIDAVRQLSRDIGIPQKLREIGVKKEDLEKLAEAAFQDVCTPGNPREVTVADILDIYCKAFE